MSNMRRTLSFTVFLMVLALLCFPAAVFANSEYTTEQRGFEAEVYYDTLEICAMQIRAMTDFEPEIAVVLGSGLGDFADNIEIVDEIPYAAIKGFPVSTAPGHEGKLIFGTYKGKLVGEFGDFASFSFQASKHLTTGEGGMLITNNEDLADKARKPWMIIQ